MDVWMTMKLFFPFNGNRRFDYDKKRSEKKFHVYFFLCWLRHKHFCFVFRWKSSSRYKSKECETEIVTTQWVYINWCRFLVCKSFERYFMLCNMTLFQRIPFITAIYLANVDKNSIFAIVLGFCTLFIFCLIKNSISRTWVRLEVNHLNIREGKANRYQITDIHINFEEQVSLLIVRRLKGYYCTRTEPTTCNLHLSHTQKALIKIKSKHDDSLMFFHNSIESITSY